MLIPHLLLMEAPVRTFPAGEVIIRQGDPGSSAYVLQEGEVIIEIDGKEVTSTSDRGTIFGEMSALLGRNRGATVVTTRESSFFIIEDLFPFLEKNPELSVQLLRLMAERIDEMNALVTDRKKWWDFF